MRVAVLCGGRGTRLGEPIKCLAEVAGRPWMDWKLDLLAVQGFKTVELWCGPHEDDFRARYEQRDYIDFFSDDQTGIEKVVRRLGPTVQWWTWGDTLLPLKTLPYDVRAMLVTRDPENANIAGIWWDCGYYRNSSELQLVEITEKPIHINTPADRKRADENLRRHGLFG